MKDGIIIKRDGHFFVFIVYRIEFWLAEVKSHASNFMWVQELKLRCCDCFEVGFIDLIKIFLTKIYGVAEIDH